MLAVYALEHLSNAFNVADAPTGSDHLPLVFPADLEMVEAPGEHFNGILSQHLCHCEVQEFGEGADRGFCEG